jgi:phosphate transport system protein
MMVETSKTHMLSHDFEADLRSLREQLTTMAHRCREQLHLALDAFWTGSKDKMADVETSDRAIDRDEKSADALVLSILALRQPVATDLRMLTAALRVVTDLERIGDEAVDLARGTPSSADGAEPARGRLREMTDETERALGTALDAFFRGDPKTAAGVGSACEAISTRYGEVVRETIAFTAQHPAEVQSAMSNLILAKCLERVASHAANIAQGALFVAGQGDMPR